jgi:hypothetical protein
MGAWMNSTSMRYLGALAPAAGRITGGPSLRPSQPTSAGAAEAVPAPDVPALPTGLRGPPTPWAQLSPADRELR